MYLLAKYNTDKCTLSMLFLKKVDFSILFTYNEYMDKAELKMLIKKSGMTYAEISEKSGIPISTIKAICGNQTKAPRVDTMDAIISVLGLKEKAEGNPQHDEIDQIMKKVQTLSNNQLKELLIIIEHFIKAIQK